MGFGVFGSLLHICRKTLSHASLFLRLLEGSCLKANMFELNMQTFVKRIFGSEEILPPMSSNNNRVSHLLPIPETETCPQTGDGGDGVEGLPPGCLSMGASKTMRTHNLTFIFWGVMTHNIWGCKIVKPLHFSWFLGPKVGVVSWKFAKTEDCFLTKKILPPYQEADDVVRHV